MGNRLSKIYTRTGDDGSTGLADGSRVRKDDLRVEAMGALDELNSALGLALASELPAGVAEALQPPLREFILPGGTAAAARLHLARAICRRAERALFRLEGSGEFVNPQARRYLNRLSDLLFVAARRAVRDSGADEVLWQPRPRPRD